MAIKRKAKAFVEKLWAKIAPKYAGASQKTLEAAFKNVVAELPDNKLKRELVAELGAYCAQLTRLKQSYCEEKATTKSCSTVRFPFNMLLPGEPTLDVNILKEDVKLHTASLLASKSGDRLSMSNLAYGILTAGQQTHDVVGGLQKSDQKLVRSHLTALRLTLGSLSCAGSDASPIRRMLASFLRHLQPAVDAILSDDFFSRSTDDDAGDLSVDGLLQIVRSFLMIVVMKCSNKLSQRIQQYDDLLAATLSYYVDLQIASTVRSAIRQRSAAEADAAAAEAAAREAGDSLAVWIQFLLRDCSPLVAVDVLLQLTAPQMLPTVAVSATGQDVANGIMRLVLLPLHRKLLSTPVMDAPQALSHSCESYAKFVAAIKAAKSCFDGDVDDVVAAARKVAAPASFLEWLAAGDSTLIDELPIEKRFHGVRITRFVIDEAENSLCEQLVQLTYRDKPLLEELLKEASAASSSADAASAVGLSDAALDRGSAAVGDSIDDFLSDDDTQLFFVDKGCNDDLRRKLTSSAGSVPHKESKKHVEKDELEIEEEEEEEMSLQQRNAKDDETEEDNVSDDEDTEQDDEEIIAPRDAVRSPSQGNNGRRSLNSESLPRGKIVSLKENATGSEDSHRKSSTMMLNVSDVTPASVVAALTALPLDENGGVPSDRDGDVVAGRLCTGDVGPYGLDTAIEAATDRSPSATRSRDVRNKSRVTANAASRAIPTQSGKGRRTQAKCDERPIVDANAAAGKDRGRGVAAVCSPMANPTVHSHSPVDELATDQAIDATASQADAPRVARKRTGTSAPSPCSSPAASTAVLPAAKVARRAAVSQSSRTAAEEAADAVTGDCKPSRKRAGRPGRDACTVADDEAIVVDGSAFGDDHQTVHLDQAASTGVATVAGVDAAAATVSLVNDALTAGMQSGRRQRRTSSCSESSTCSYTLRSAGRATPLKGHQQPPAATADEPVRRGYRRSSVSSTSSVDEALAKANKTPSGRRTAAANVKGSGSLAGASNARASARSRLLSPLVEADDADSKSRRRIEEDSMVVTVSQRESDCDRDDAASVASSMSDVLPVLGVAAAGRSPPAATARRPAPAPARTSAARQKATRTPAKAKIGSKQSSVKPPASDDHEQNIAVVAGSMSPSSEHGESHNSRMTRYSLRCRSTPSAVDAQH